MLIEDLNTNFFEHLVFIAYNICCLTASVDYWSGFLATDAEIQVRFPALPDFLTSSGSETGFTQTREYN
jgi:hypothetical protein